MSESNLDQLRAQNVQVVRNFYRYCIEKDAEKLNQLWAENAIMYTKFSIPPLDPTIAPPKIDGAEALREFWASFINTANRLNFSTLHIDAFAEPELVLARFTTDHETGDGVPYKNEEVCLVRLKDGKITEYHEYSNPLVIMKSFMKGKWVMEG